MTDLRLTNTLTNKKEIFEPRKNGCVKLFTCGPSVYRRQHLGNYRTYLFEDVLQKHLGYLGFHVDRLVNLTDIEDKAVAEARERGVSLREQVRPVEEAFYRECGLLGIDLPATMPRATSSVDAAVDLIRTLVDRGHAYWHDGEVFFDPLTYEGFGRVYGLDMSLWPKEKVRFRKDTYPGRRWNLGDFILWHKRRDEDGEFWWDTPIGQGRPAWNVQDASMITKHFGFQIDIHTGGIDNIYRHHDYTLAVMESASGIEFCRWWLHGGHLLVNGRKMSKSEGNVSFVDDLIGRGFHPRHIRFFLLYGHYREKLDMSISRLEERAGYLDRIRLLGLRLFSCTDKNPRDKSDGLAKSMLSEYERCMNDDLDYAGAFDAVARHLESALSNGKDIACRVRSSLQAAVQKVDKILGVLGLDGS